MTKTRKAAVLIAVSIFVVAAGVAVFIFATTTSRSPAADWVVSVKPGSTEPAFIFAVFRRGGFAYRNDGFVFWVEGQNAFLKTPLSGLPTYGQPRPTMIDLSSPGVASPGSSDAFLSLARRMDGLPAGVTDSADAYEYYVYMKIDGEGRKYWTDDEALSRCGLAPRFHGVTDALF